MSLVKVDGSIETLKGVYHFASSKVASISFLHHDLTTQLVSLA